LSPGQRGPRPPGLPPEGQHQDTSVQGKTI
jgi:hypothetical protein